MRLLAMIFPLFALFAACKSPTFTYVKEVDHRLPLFEFTMDTTFKLYTRTICKDSSNFPDDCVADTVRPVEVGYIILSEAHRKVLAINNVPNRNQKFYEEGIVYEEMIASDSVFINSFFFKQFRFGTLQAANGGLQMKFISAEKHPATFHWNYKVLNDVLEVSSVANVRADGEDIRYTVPGLYLVPKFRRSHQFKMVFQLPGNMTKNPVTNMSEARIYVHKKSKKNYITYIEFEKPVHNEFRAIKFASNRMYAFSQ